MIFRSAAFAINALILLGTMLAGLIAVYTPGVNGAVVGPFRPEAYLTAYGFLALPNAFIATAIQFSIGVFSRHSRGAYLGSILLFFFAYVLSTIVYWVAGRPDLARLIDPIGVITSVAVSIVQSVSEFSLIVNRTSALAPALAPTSTSAARIPCNFIGVS